MKELSFEPRVGIISVSSSNVKIDTENQLRFVNSISVSDSSTSFNKVISYKNRKESKKFVRI